MHCDPFFLSAGTDIPNNPALPVLIYRGVLPDSPDRNILFEKHFTDHGWHGIWRDGIYDYHHFHSMAHEVLGVIHGQCRIHLGGPGGPTIALEPGDMIVLPAGTGHKDHGSDNDLVVIGAYPPGQIMDICRSVQDCPNALATIAATPVPALDPFYGREGPLLRFWAF